MSDDLMVMAQEKVFNAFSVGNKLGWLTLVGIDQDVFSTGLTPQDEETMLLYISGMGDSAAWARGDYALYVRDKIKRAANGDYEQYTKVWGNEIVRLAKLFGVKVQTLRNNISTCSAWPIQYRIAGGHVRYKHHEAIPSKLSMEERLDLIRQAEEEEWNWTRLYVVAHNHAEPDGEPKLTSKPSPELANPDEAPAEDVDDEDFDDTIEGEDEGEYDDQFTRLNTVSIYLNELAGNSVIAQDTSEAMTITISFGNGVTFQVTPDLSECNLRVKRI